MAEPATPAIVLPDGPEPAFVALDGHLPASALTGLDGSGLDGSGLERLAPERLAPDEPTVDPAPAPAAAPAVAPAPAALEQAGPDPSADGPATVDPATVDPAAPTGPSPWLVLLRCLAAGVTTALAVLLLWPASLGGRSVLVVVHGTSMAPLFQPGDLLYGQVADRYAVGEIAIFRVPEGPTAGQLVVHRVVGMADDGRYIMEGDNRPDEDGLRPGPDDMVARPLLDLGPWPVRVFRTLPWILGGLVASALGRVLWPVEPAPATRRSEP